MMKVRVQRAAELVVRVLSKLKSSKENKKRLFVGLCGVALVSIYLYSSKFNNPQREQYDLTYVGNCNIDEAGFTEEQLESLLIAHQDEYAKQIRVTLDTYLSGETIDPIVIEGEFKDEIDVYDKVYLHSPLMVLHVQNGLSGGMDYRIYSVNKPDKIFEVWVYQNANGAYGLRSFSDTGLLEHEVSEILGDTFRDFNKQCILEDERLQI